MKKFYVNCNFNGQESPFSVYIGSPEGGHHSLHFQSEWLGKNRSGSVSPGFMDAVGKLSMIANKHGVLLEDLCVYAIGAAQQDLDTSNTATDEEEYAGDETYSDDLDMDFDDMIMAPDPDGNEMFLEEPDGESKDGSEAVSDEYLDEELRKFSEEENSFSGIDIDDLLSEEDASKRS